MTSSAGLQTAGERGKGEANGPVVSDDAMGRAGMSSDHGFEFARLAELRQPAARTHIFADGGDFFLAEPRHHLWNHPFDCASQSKGLVHSSDPKRKIPAC